MLELELYHHKAIFDAFNEALDAYRPYGLKGLPYSWKLSQPHNPSEIGQRDINKILLKAKERVFAWCGVNCGILGTTVEMPGRGLVALNEEQINHVKEDRLAKMLSQEVTESEEKWICYEDQETYLQMEFADLIFDRLASETAENLYRIICNRRAENNPSST